MYPTEIDEMGPIDYILVEWPDRQPTGEAAPIVVDLVERGKGAAKKFVLNPNDMIAA